MSTAIIVHNDIKEILCEIFAPLNLFLWVAIVIYHIISINKWTDVADKKYDMLINNMHSNNYCFSLDERYLYILDENIKVLDLTQMSIITNTKKLPSYTSDSNLKYYGIIMAEPLRQELIISGYVRECWSKCKIGDDRYPPVHLVKVMQSFCTEEYLHILTRKMHRPVYCCGGVGGSRSFVWTHVKIETNSV